MNLSTWRDVAIVLLALEAFLGVLVAGAACYFGIRGVFWLKDRIPRLTRPAGCYLVQAENVIRQAGNAATAPFIIGGANAARLRAAWRAATRPERRNSNV